MRNLQSKSFTAVVGTVYHVRGNTRRQTIIFNSPTETTWDVALCPLGTTDPTDYWMVGLDIRNFQVGGIHHFGEIFIRDVDNVQDEIINFISDVEVVIEEA